MNRTWKLCTCGAVALVLASASLAIADPIDNPGAFTLDLSNPHTFLDLGPATSYQLPPGDGSPGSADVDGIAASDGTISYYAAITTVKQLEDIGTQTLYGQLQIISFAGNLDANTGQYDLTMRVRIRFSGSAVTIPCNTPYFEINFKDTKSWGGLSSLKWTPKTGPENRV